MLSWTCAQVLAEFKRRWPEHGAQLNEQNRRTASHQVGFLGVQQVHAGSWPMASSMGSAFRRRSTRPAGSMRAARRRARR
jgi:hypothetical protein